jgi:hypothetical protein
MPRAIIGEDEPETAERSGVIERIIMMLAQQRGAVPPAAEGPVWTPEEDALSERLVLIYPLLGCIGKIVMSNFIRGFAVARRRFRLCRERNCRR